MSIGAVAADFGKGLFAGAAGTAAMTVSSTLEMKLSGRGASQTPAQAAEEVLGVQPEDEETEARFSTLMHWGYGTGWGGVRGLLASAGLSGPVATAAHLGLVWGAEQVVLPVLNVSAPVFKYGGKAPATDLEYRRQRFAARYGPPEGSDEGYEERSLAYQRFRRELLGAERAALLRLRGEGRISDEVRRRVERDLEDTRLEI